MITLIVMWDWDGTLVDTMPDHADLAAECIEKHLKIPRQEARKKYLATAGIPFHEQLVEITGSEQKQCAQEYHLRKLSEVYQNPANFPETEATIKAIADNIAGVIQAVSSSTQECLIEQWAEKSLSKYFFRIYGSDHGSKEDHIALIREMFPKAKIIFVSDAVFSGPISTKEIIWAICGVL